MMRVSMPSPAASRRNLEKANAVWRAPRPWRSEQESRVIRRLVWQWFIYPTERKWSSRALARHLGVSLTYVRKLVREFSVDPARVQQECGHSEATFEDLMRAQGQTQAERARGLLRVQRYRAVVPVSPREAPAWAGGRSDGRCSPYDPLAAVKYSFLENEEKQRWRPVRFARRRWLPGSI